MSRHIIPALKPGLVVVVGWDRPMRTFFGQVIDHAQDEEGQMLCWAGGLFDEHKTVESLAAAISDYATLKEGIVAQLNADKMMGH